MSLIKRFFGAFSGRDESGTQYPGPIEAAPDSGVTVTEDIALQQSAVFACVRKISGVIGSIPLQVFEGESRNRVEAKDTIIYKKLAMRPNSFMDSSVFWEYVGATVALHGNFYGRKKQDVLGRIHSIIPMDSNQMEVVAAEDSVEFHYTKDGKTTVYKQDDIFHVRGFGGIYTGYSPLRYAAQNIGLSVQNDSVVKHLAKNGGRVSGALKVDKLLNVEERAAIRKNIIRPIENGSSGATVLLEKGLEYQALQINPNDLQMLESRRFTIEDIARMFDVPSVLINDSGNSTVWGSGVEQIILGFYKLAIRQYLVKIESAIKNQLLTPEEQERYTVEFNFEALLRGDVGARAALYNVVAPNGIMTRNEIRKRENLPSVEGGDNLTVQMNLTNIQDLGNEQNVV